jgi:hypothetical protein
VDHAADGIGTVSGIYGGGSFQVLAVPHPLYTNRWTLSAEGVVGLSKRRIEVGVRRRAWGTFVDALFSESDLVLGGGSPTDAYDSALGTYASQAVQTDTWGTYAQTGGDVGSNGGIELNGSGVRVRGNAIPGPLHEVVLSGGASVQGDRAPRQYDVVYEPASYGDFQSALLSNANNTIAGGGQGNTVRYHAGRKTLDVAGGATLTLGAGTYFFTSITLKGNSRILVTGPVEIYVTDLIDLAAGARIDAARPADVRIYAHPYDLPQGASPGETRVKVNSGSHVTWALLAPGADLDLGGGNHFYGAAVARTVSISGGNAFHYDKALGRVEGGGVATMERLYWRDLAPPRR